ncbi:hypothetical protein [Streptomyces sp. HSG2]|uniref:hypothetical protein n=1 Tax=Streptomyces sp. HSG2 TaxID=2797167 RepID=UPI0019050739|nr:hypothetical protein [Streptomyces sp. HSG2]
MVHSFEELVQKRRAAEQARSRVRELRDRYGPPARGGWTSVQSDTYETAVRAWRDLDRDASGAMADYARGGGGSLREVEDSVRRAAGDAESDL